MSAPDAPPRPQSLAAQRIRGCPGSSGATWRLSEPFADKLLPVTSGRFHLKLCATETCQKALKGRDSLAQGNAPGIQKSLQLEALKGRNIMRWMCLFVSPFQSFDFSRIQKPRALPWAKLSRPFGALDYRLYGRELLIL